MKNLALSFLVLLAGLSWISAQDFKEITLENIYENRTFSPGYVWGLRSMNDGEHYTRLEKQSLIIKYSYKTGKEVARLLEVGAVKTELIGKISNYIFSADESRILLETGVEPIYRHSYKASYYIYEVSTKKLELLSENGKQQLASWSPDGTKIAFVRDNNIYVRNLDSKEEIQITTSGEWNKIINGAPDWVYEEEFGFSQGFEWSPDSKSIAYYEFDESGVKEYSMPMYNDLYPSLYTYKYPKAGEDNSKVTVHVYNLDKKEDKTVLTSNDNYEYFPRIKWTRKADNLMVYAMNRPQNKLFLHLYNTNTGENPIIYQEENEYYIDISDNIYFLEKGETFIFTSEKDGFNHLYEISLDGKNVRQITKGNFEVTSLLGYNEKSKTIYYESTEESPMQRHAYTIDINGLKKTRLTTRQGTNELEFSNGFKYFINFNSSANTPYYISLHDAKGKEIRVLESNESLVATAKEYGFLKKEFITIKAGEYDLNAWIIKPPKFDESKKYPVFMYVYGGPGSQTVEDSWSYDLAWYQMLAQKGYIIVSVDNRGTGARGEKFKKMTYLQLGKYETEDQIEAAKFLGTLPYVDATRIGIFGWSYGGYMSTLCITKGADYFKTAIAVAPVTNWRYYDNIYTERFMRTPQENADGYDSNSPINHIDKLKGNYLLVHGTADDNVHYQNSMELVAELVRADKQFDVFFYPNSNHSMNGRNARYHLYRKMTNFILENL